MWARNGRRPVIVDVGAGTAARWVSAEELEELTRVAARRLLASGVAPGARVLVCLPTSLAAVVTYVAVLRTGILVGVPVNPAYTERELAHIVHDVRPAVAVVEGGWRGDAVTAASSGATAVLVLDPVGDPASFFSAVSVRAGTAAADGGPGDVALDGARPGDVALIAYTSGTTGSPKGAMLSHANLLANSESIARTWRWEGSDRLVHALPVFHGHGLCVAMFTSLLTGSSVVLVPRFDAAAVLDAASKHAATMFFGVPTMYHRLAASSRVGELARLRLAVSGSAALRPELHDAMRAAGTVVLERYGMTETLMTLSNPYDGERRPGTVGFPFPGVDAEVAGADGGGAEGHGGGEVRVQGPAVFSGYWERPAATADCFDGAWFRTGDLGVVEEGYVRLLGRSSEVIISGGYNVYPAEVEDVLLGHPSVAEAAVSGLPSDEWGETVCAWVVADGAASVDAGALLAFAAERLAPYKCPRQVRFVASLPRNAMGKVRRSELQ